MITRVVSAVIVMLVATFGWWTPTIASGAGSPSPVHDGQLHGGQMDDGQMIEPTTDASFTPKFATLAATGWTATASDQDSAAPASAAIDGNKATVWHSRYRPSPAPLPHTLTIDMAVVRTIGGLIYTPRQDASNNGNIGQFRLSTSLDGTTWSGVTTSGTWADTKASKTVVFPATAARYLRLTALSEAGNRGPWSSAAEVAVVAGQAAGVALSRVGWTASASDEQSGNRAAGVLDGNAGSIWHSYYSTPAKPLPHSLTIDMHQAQPVNGLTYLPRQDASKNGTIGTYQVDLSVDGAHWTRVAAGQWADTKVEKYATFASATARYVRLTALTEAGTRGPWTSAAEIEVLGPNTSGGSSGAWSAPYQFPVTPTSAAVLSNNKVLLFAGYNATNFDMVTPITAVAILDTVTGTVSQSTLIRVGHQMFCAGLAMLADGRLLINGGSSDASSTIYDPYKDTWTAVAKMNIPRAYQSTTLLSNGSVFTLGGSWDPPPTGTVQASKDGEVYTPAASGPGTWRRLRNVSATAILTNDHEDARLGRVYRSDNHPWLFAASNGTVFQAGPSKQMNWISTRAAGAVVSAGPRSDSDHAMNGNAVMYAPGKILTLGGAPDYQATGVTLGEQATTRAHTIDISDGYGKPVTVTRTGDLHYRRSFANAVVLPDGNVLVLGGQQSPVAFTDTGSANTPELWDPSTGSFSTLQADTGVARTYHSLAVLLPDGRVLSGGGGLCGACTVNHPDGRIFTPPYLLNADGSLRTRPAISSAPAAAAPGDVVRVTTTGPVAGFALVRASAATHGVNTDQRRIPLSFTGTGTSYDLSIPSDTGVVLPGSYLLFAIDTAGTPSVAAMVLVR